MIKTEKYIPRLRFPEFKEEWKTYRIDNILTRVSNQVKVDKNLFYQQIGIRSHGKGLFHKDLVSGKSLGNKRVFWIKEDMLVLNIVFAWEQAVAKTTNSEIGMIASHRFPMYKPVSGVLDLEVIVFIFLTKKGKYLLELASPGGAGRNKTLGQQTFNELKVTLPALPEQQKISGFLSAVDKKIEQLTRKKELLEKYKKGVMQGLFAAGKKSSYELGVMSDEFITPLRFKDENGNDYPDWEEKWLGEASVKKSSNVASNTLENCNGEYPIYGASGYLKGVDFYNEAKKFVAIVKDGAGVGRNFLCPTKSSVLGTLDILLPKPEHSVEFLYYSLQQIRFTKYIIGSTIPHIYFKDYSKERLGIPHIHEQIKISIFLGSIQNKIDIIQSQIDQTQKFKKGLLQQMFV